MKINKYIDHTNLKRDAKEVNILKTIEEAIEYNFKTVCSFPIWIELIASKVHEHNIQVTAVCGFPYGTQTTETKVFEGQDAIKRGADELDFVINVSKLHDGNYDYIKNELEQIRKATKGTTIKLILETGLLTDDEKRMGAKLGKEAGFDFIKTSTGIDTTGATVEDVKLIREVVGNNIQIKASGGIKTFEAAQSMINAGADRLGTSSGVAIMQGKEGKEDY